MGLVDNKEIMTMRKYLNVFVQEDFKADDGEIKSNYTKVGAAFPHDKGEGFNIRLTNGIAVSGDLVAFPPKDDNAS